MKKITAIILLTLVLSSAAATAHAQKDYVTNATVKSWCDTNISLCVGYVRGVVETLTFYNLLDLKIIIAEGEYPIPKFCITEGTSVAQLVLMARMGWEQQPELSQDKFLTGFAKNIREQFPCAKPKAIKKKKFVPKFKS